MWRFRFPEDIQANLVSQENPHGKVTNSDLEHAGLLAQVSLMVTTHDFHYATLANASDNTPSDSRVSHGAASSDGGLDEMRDNRLSFIYVGLAELCETPTFK